MLENIFFTNQLALFMHNIIANYEKNTSDVQMKEPKVPKEESISEAQAFGQMLNILTGTRNRTDFLQHRSRSCLD